MKVRYIEVLACRWRSFITRTAASFLSRCATLPVAKEARVGAAYVSRYLRQIRVLQETEASKGHLQFHQLGRLELAELQPRQETFHNFLRREWRPGMRPRAGPTKTSPQPTEYCEQCHQNADSMPDTLHQITKNYIMSLRCNVASMGRKGSAWNRRAFSRFGDKESTQER